jgi:hypothetical protein
MRKENHMRRTLIASSLALVATGVAAQDTLIVPDNLRGSAKESLALVVPARGVQIYECRAKNDPYGAYEWTFVAPEADLFDAKGNKIGAHYAGPRWEAADGSTIEGKVKERANAPRTGAIPWLLLATKSVGAEGSFSKVTSIQRVNTAGGVTPGTGCYQATVGTTARVPYTADYYLLSEK